MTRWPAGTTTVAVCVLGVSLLCMLEISASAQPPRVMSVDGEDGNRNGKFTCKDTEGKRPGCNGTCPDSCPQKCIALCPYCKTYCPADFVQPVKPALFVFGDGELDVGNNNHVPGGSESGEPVRANHSYYGINFPNQEATGRFSNGYNTADFIAKYMGLEMSPPAYKSLPTPSPASMEGFTGVNYACGMAGIRSSTNGELTFSLPDQLEYFNATRAQMEAKLGTRALSELLSKSLFLIWVGSMDLLPDCNYFLTSPSRDNKTEIERLIGFYGDSVTALYNKGARKFAIINVGLIGCGPTRSSHGSSSGCDEGVNKNAAEFNDALKPLMASLGSKLGGLRYSIADFNAFSNATFADPAAAGFMDTHNACCRYGCNTRPCDNSSEYWFWDEGYMTQQAAMLVTAAFYDGPANYTMPVNFKKLIENQ